MGIPSKFEKEATRNKKDYRQQSTSSLIGQLPFTSSQHEWKIYTVVVAVHARLIR